ncbi:hypothetical protein LCM20_02165 [Halobacillus litoralis]|uniref:hypothetical protein n=1 Tax=Halobacillus litoralis TaxID=45668 RepID=UPI001CD35CA1|nr:hypothetical protein [Halobacillus litoralis]MCA0969394.1 hypothetical protein [Halobacillus litoralis]
MKTDHETAFETFDTELHQSTLLQQYQLKKVAGLPFVYLWPSPSVDRRMLEDMLKLCAAKAMKGKRLTLEMSYVRKSQAFYVYRVRFLVPQRKMFCCGNLCDDCIRFTS